MKFMNFPALNNLILILTYTCQLRCKMCGQVDAPEDAPNANTIREQLDLDIIEKRIKEFPYLRTVYLFGGEPLVYRQIIPLLEFLKKQNIGTSFSTNGILLKKFAKDIIRSGVEMISVSLDSHTPRLHDEIRGMSGSLEKALEALDFFLEKRKEMKTKSLKVKIHFTIIPDNYDTMLDYYDYYIDRYPDIDVIKFAFPRFATQEMGKEYERVMHNEFHVQGLSWQGNFSVEDYTKSYGSIDVNSLYYQISTLLKRPKTSVAGPVQLEEIREYFNEPGKQPQGRHCACFRSVAIQPNGDVVQCADYPDYVMGNIHDQSLQEIWMGEKSQAWKVYLKTNGNPGVLVKCSRLYPGVGSKTILSKMSRGFSKGGNFIRRIKSVVSS